MRYTRVMTVRLDLIRYSVDSKTGPPVRGGSSMTCYSPTVIRIPRAELGPGSVPACVILGQDRIARSLLRSCGCFSGRVLRMVIKGLLCRQGKISAGYMSMSIN
jgi:hypothetical protein